MTELTPELAAELERAFRAHPFAGLMGIRLTSIATGRCALAMTASPHQANLHGTLHGGAIATLLDMAMGAAVYTLNVRAVTVELVVTYLAPANPGELVTATGEVTHRGRRIIVAQSTARGPAGTVARGHGLYLPRGSFLEFES
ncbi:MAG: PaaI family thioesterase [Desulfotomaculales bacterium]